MDFRGWGCCEECRKKETAFLPSFLPPPGLAGASGSRHASRTSGRCPELRDALGVSQRIRVSGRSMHLWKGIDTSTVKVKGGKGRWDSGVGGDSRSGLLAMQGLSDAAASGPRVAMSGLGAWPHGGSVLPGPQTNSSSRRSCTCDSTFSRACVQDDRGSRGSPPRARSTYRVSLILSGAEQVRIQPATASAAPELASRALTCRAVLLPRAVGIRHPASLSRCP